MVKDQLQTNKLKNHTKMGKFQMQERHWLWHRAVSSVVFNHRRRGYYGSRPGYFTRYIHASLLVKDPRFFIHTTDWPTCLVFQLLSIANNSVHRGSQSVRAWQTWPNQIRCLFQRMNPSTSTLRPTSELLIKFSRHVLPTLQRQPCSDTDSLRTSVSSGLTVQPTLPLQSTQNYRSITGC